MPGTDTRRSPQADDGEALRSLRHPGPGETDRRAEFARMFQRAPMPDGELLHNLGLFLTRQTLSRILFMHELYQHVLPVHGSILEFGTRWGQNLALFSSLRGMYEPFNHSRRIIGFDTFAGFPSVAEQDGSGDIISEGAYAVTAGYEEYLQRVLEFHEAESPLAHIRKFEIVKGDAAQTVPQWLDEHPETIVALAYFDFDLYEPTRVCLEAIRPRLTRGSVIGFDELNHPDFPGETVAVREVLGLDRYRIVRSPLNPMPSYLIVE